MSEGAAAAPAPVAPTNGAAPAATQAPAAPKPNGVPRSTSGQFAPKEGAQGKVVEPGPGATDAAKEEWRFKEKLKVYGQEEDVDLDRDGVKRELQQARAMRKQHAEMQKKLAEREELEALFEKDPDEYMRRRGKDPEEYLKQKIHKVIEREQLTEEQRATQDAIARADAAEAKLQKQEEARKATQQKLRTEHAKKQMVERYGRTIEAAGLERNAETIFLMAEVEDIAAKQGLEYTPEELGKETARRARGYGKSYLDSLTVPAFISEIGKERYEAILEHSIAQLEGSSAVVPAPKEPVVRREPTSEGSRYLSEAELDRNLREFMKKKGVR